jgi:hypothetical protein
MLSPQAVKRGTKVDLQHAVFESVNAARTASLKGR